MNTDLHGFDDRVARLLAVVAHPVDRHVDGEFPHHRFPKSVPVGQGRRQTSRRSKSGGLR